MERIYWSTQVFDLEKREREIVITGHLSGIQAVVPVDRLDLWCLDQLRLSLSPENQEWEPGDVDRRRVT